MKLWDLLLRRRPAEPPTINMVFGNTIAHHEGPAISINVKHPRAYGCPCEMLITLGTMGIKICADCGKETPLEVDSRG